MSDLNDWLNEYKSINLRGLRFVSRLTNGRRNFKGGTHSTLPMSWYENNGQCFLYILDDWNWTYNNKTRNISQYNNQIKHFDVNIQLSVKFRMSCDQILIINYMWFDKKVCAVFVYLKSMFLFIYIYIVYIKTISIGYNTFIATFFLVFRTFTEFTFWY